jgi:hypothetical protein
MVGNINAGRRAGLVAVGALIAAIAIPGAVSADTTPGPPGVQPASSRGATIEVDPNISITAKVVATAHLSFVCDPFDVFDWQTGQTIQSTDGSLEDFSVAIIQASGKQVNWGVSEAFGGPVVCDGSTKNKVETTIVPSLVPWKSGAAVVGASVFIASPDFQSSHAATSGPLQIKLSK